MKYTTANEILSHFQNIDMRYTINQKGHPQYKALCPAHDDNTESLSISDDQTKKQIIFNCFKGCTKEAILKSIGLTKNDCFYSIFKETEYKYYDENNMLRYTITRFNDKSFLKTPKNVEALLYRLPELLESQNNTIFIVEGEKDCDNLRQFGFTVTSASGGITGFKEEFVKYFLNKNVIMIRDNDNAGFKYAEKLKYILLNNVKTLKIGTVPIGKDISDYIFELKKTEFDIKEKLVFLFNSFKIQNAISFKDEKGRINQSLLADYIIEKYKLINYNGEIYSYNNGDYKIANLNVLIRKECRDVTIPIVNNVISDIKVYTPYKEQESNPNFIKVLNGIYDIENDVLHENSSDYFIPNTIPYEYNENAYCETLDNSLDEWCAGNKEKRMLIEEMFGYSIYRSSKFKKFFILQGETNCGKSTLLKLFETLVGYENSNSAKLEELTKPFSSYNLINKLVNIGDDISGKLIQDSELLKSITSGHSVKVRQIYKQEITMNNYATLIFACNKLPKMPDVSGGLDSRHVIIPIVPNFKKINYNLEKTLNSNNSIEYLLKLAINGLRRLLNNNYFTMSQDVLDMIEECKRNNNSIIEWVSQFQDITGKLVDQLAIDIYQEYSRDIKLGGGFPNSNKTFRNEIKRICSNKIKLVRNNKDGKNIYIFRRIDYND